MDELFLNGCNNVDSEFYNTANNTSQGNVAKSWQWRQLGMNPKGSASNKRILQEAAEDHLVNKEILSERCCEVPGVPRSTFLMVFSPDGTKVASTHGNHNVYVSELSTGKHVKTLSGHPRTPWCIAFHPSHTQLLGSGCLGGEVRVWDLSGGSEVWTVSSETVIASIAFHPRDQLLVIATYNELYFWDWSQPQPFTKVQTNTIKEKVRFVSFDALGHKLITGISVWSVPGSQAATPTRPEVAAPTRPEAAAPADQTATYNQLLERYNSLVRNYRRLILAQTHFTTTTDRGTDPMETDRAAERGSASVPPPARPRLPPRATSYPSPPFASRGGGPSSPGPSSTETLTASPPSSVVPLPGEGPAREGGARHSAFRPLTVIRGRGPSPSLSHRPPDTASPAAGQTARLRGELTASLGRLQYFMEHSIDETLNFPEHPDTTASHIYRLQLLYERARSPRSGGVFFTAAPRESGDEVPLRTFGRLPLGIDRDRLRPDRDETAGSSGVGQPTVGSDLRAGLFSSDDGSDSDREMFSPLPLHIYRTRNWSAAADPSLDGFVGFAGLDHIPSFGGWDSAGRTSRREAADLSEPLLASAPPEVRDGAADADRDVVNTEEPQRDAPPRPDVDPESRDSERRSGEAFQKVILGVQAIQRHTESLIALCSENATRPPLLRLRRHWEDLRRDMIRMHRPSFGDRGPPSYFSLSARQRCDLLSGTTGPSVPVGPFSPGPSVRLPRDTPSEPAEDKTDNVQNRRDTEGPRDTERRIPNLDGDDLNSPSTSSGIGRPSRMEPATSGRDRDRRPHAEVMNGISRRLCGMRRTIRSIGIRRRYRVDRAPVPSFRRDSEPTRDSVRLHARRVLSIMFSIMMQCVDTDRLGGQIIEMLKSLKRALGLSSLLLASPAAADRARTTDPPRGRDEAPRPAASASVRNEPPLTGTRRRAALSWSDRVAVQISAANRNNSSNARHRRETYHNVKKARAMRAFQPSLFNFSAGRDTASPHPEAAGSSIPSRERIDSREAPADTRSARGPRDPGASRIYSRLLLRRFFYNPARRSNATGPPTRQESGRRDPVSDAESSNSRPGPAHLSGGPDTGEAEGERRGGVVVPAVRINDVPLYDVFPNLVPLRRRLASGIAEYLQQNNALSIDENEGVGIIDAGPSLVSETSASPVHRIQAWDFAQGRIPDISDANQNIVVHKCKIHNDASIDISRDGRLLVALLPAQRMRNITHRLGIYSLDWNCLGECLYTALLEQNAVSVSLSPCARHLAVGLGSRRVSLQPYGRNGVMALIFRLGPLQKNDTNSRSGCLILLRRLEQSWELGITSLNCLRWAPQPGQGLVYANNTGQLKILS